MNSYSINFNGLASTDTKITQLLTAVTVGNTLSVNFKVNESSATVGGNPVPVATFSFDLPFALSNVNVNPLAYDTRFQSVKEFLDKPYCVAGRVVTIIQNRNVSSPYDIQKDLDNYLRYPIALRVSGTMTQMDLYIGIVNSTLTESYAPLGITSLSTNGGAGIVAVKIFDPADLRFARLQDNLVTGLSNASSGGAIPAGPGGVSSTTSQGAIPRTVINRLTR